MTQLASEKLDLTQLDLPRGQKLCLRTRVADV
jgi:hypothetical protein